MLWLGSFGGQSTLVTFEAIFFTNSKALVQARVDSLRNSFNPIFDSVKKDKSGKQLHFFEEISSFYKKV